MEISISLKIDDYAAEKLLKVFGEDFVDLCKQWDHRNDVPCTVPHGAYVTEPSMQGFRSMFKDMNRPPNHELKTWPRFFDDMRREAKRFDLRKEDDRKFHNGDVILYREWDPEMEPAGDPVQGMEKSHRYTGRDFKAMVTYCMRHEDFEGVPENYVILGIKVLPEMKLGM